MALIKCPECDNKISDKADSCPKCGYELHKVSNEKSNNGRFNQKNKKDGYRYLFIFAVLVILFLLFTQNRNSSNNNDNNNGTTNPSSTNGYMVYNDARLNISFEYPNGYKIVTDNDGFIYISKNVNNKKAVIPYVIIGRYEKFNNSVQFLNSFTDYMRKNYSDLKLTIDLVSGNIGDKVVYGLAYNYTSSNHLIVDNRYATVINNVVYMIGSKEENSNSTEVNNLVEHIISTLTVGGN